MPCGTPRRSANACPLRLVDGIGDARGGLNVDDFVEVGKPCLCDEVVGPVVGLDRFVVAD